MLLADAVAGSSHKPVTPREPLLDDSSPLLVADGLPTVREPTAPSNQPAARNIVEDARKRLRLTVKSIESFLLVQARGELVVLTSLQLNAAITKLLATGYRLAIFDVTHVTQCDATGLGAVLLFSQELRDRGGRLILAAPKETRQKFEIIKGFTRAVEFFESVDTAAAELRQIPPSP